MSLLAAAENREASPIGLVVVLVLLVALVFLIRSMNRHLRKVPASFSRSAARPSEAHPPEVHRSEPHRDEAHRDEAHRDEAHRDEEQVEDR
jgi:hypothetical protein